jgi:hypothetical protein
MGMLYIKVRKKGAKGWKFISSHGNTTRLKREALMFEPEQAETQLKQLREYNPEHHYETQPL